MRQTHKKNQAWIHWLGGLLVVLLAAGLYFIYGVLPPQIARTIAAKALVHKPLTKTPKADGFLYQDASFRSEDGISLSGWWMPKARGPKILGTIILSHGVFKNREQVLSRAEFLVNSGYQVLLFDLRGNGASGNGPISGGLLEARDYAAAYRYLKDKHLLKKPVVFFGFSLGAISALRAVEKVPEVDAVIADSPLSNLKSYVARRTMGGSFAVLPGFLGRCLSAYDRVTGLSLTPADLDLIPVVEKFKDTPVLYITGELDDLARPREVQKVFAATHSQHRRLVYIPEAGHEQTYLKYPFIYEKSVLGFLTDLRSGFAEAKDFQTAIPEKSGQAQ